MNKGRLICLRLAKEGFGAPDQIGRMPVDVVVEALHYATALHDYEETMMELNRDNQ